MSIGQVFLIVSAGFFFLDAVGATFIPRMQSWGLCSLAIGLLAFGWAFPH
jgi:hypothetical protein